MPAIVVNLTTLTAAQGFIIQGDAADDRAGYSVSNAGDVNGDGIDDMIVGAPGIYNTGSNAGKAYVIFGKVGATRANIDLSNLTATDGFIIQGDAVGDYAGFSVSNAGDINGDGIDDMVVGAPRGDNGGVNAGEAYVIFGKAGATRQNIALTTLAAADGFIIQGDAGEDWAGRSVSAAGDINGDGIDDLIIGAPFGDDGGDYAGEAYVIFGKAGATRTNIDLATLTSTDGFIIQGDASADRAGWSVSSAGDVNGDGIDDLIVAAISGDDGDINAGEVYVIFGKTGATRANMDLTSLSATDGFIIQGDASADQAGWSVSSAGDINGDGIDDLIVGTPFSDAGNVVGDFGRTYVVFGKAGATRTYIDLTTLSVTDGFIIEGAAASDRAGNSVSNAGDVDGDGIDDLIVGAPGRDFGGQVSGETFVIFGKAGASRANINLFSVSAIDGFAIRNYTALDYAGASVSGAGDVNGDGMDDLIVGAAGNDAGGFNAGAAFVIYGSRAYTSPAGMLNGTAIADILNGTTSADQINGLGGNDTLWGGLGNDALNGGDGDDFLDGGAGADAMDGGLNDDIYRVNNLGDSINDSGGLDTVQATISYVLGAALEHLVLLNSGLSGVGNIGANTLTGTAGIDTLDGGNGDDVIHGLGGADTLIGGNDIDTLRVSASGGVASISGFEALDFIGGASLTLTDTQFNGGLAQNTQVTGTGTLFVNMATAGNFITKFFSFASTTSLTVNGSTGIDIFKLGNAANNVNAGDGTDQIKGGNLVDIINGGSGVDKINGEGGADILTGGTGADVFKYASVNDSLVGDSDQITDYQIGVDRLNFGRIDTNAALAGDQGFAFVGTAAFGAGGVAQIRYANSGADLMVQADINGDGVADMEIILQGLAGGTLTAADFIL